MLQNRIPDAVARLLGGTDAPELIGIVRFYQRRDGVLVEVQADGLPKSDTGFYGFHIHDGTSCEGADFAASDGHFNPGKVPHPDHAGDLPPLLGDGGRAYMQVLTGRFRVEEVLGKAVIIHADPDDFHTQPAGNAGRKIACGIIHPVSKRSR